MNKKVTIRTPANQGNIQLLFQKAGAKENIQKSKESSEPALTSENPEVQLFYDSLKPAERIAHTIAKEKLGTSYDVTRTHGFEKWKNAKK